MIAPGTRVFFDVQATDLRKSYDGLATLARSTLDKEPAQGGLFVFLNRRADPVRILFRDPHGGCLLSKRLDRGRFRRPICVEGRFVWETESQEPLRFLGDIDFTRSTTRVRSPLQARLHVLQGERIE